MAVKFERKGNIGNIILDRPPANSYEMTFMTELGDAIDAAIADTETRVVILKSASEKFFCAGADIKAFAANSTEENMKMVDVAHGALGKMAKSDKVFVAAINGHAYGGGFEIALACDLRFAADAEYGLGLPEVNLGLLPGNGGTQRLSRLVGAGKALELMLTGTVLSPQEALSLGLVNKLFPPDKLQEDVEAFATKLARGATRAIASIKKAVYQGIEQNLENALALERNLVAPLFDTADAKEGITAFVEKRKPAFSGN